MGRGGWLPRVKSDLFVRIKGCQHGAGQKQRRSDPFALVWIQVRRADFFGLDTPGMAVDLDSFKDKELTIPCFEVKVVDDLRLLRDWVDVMAVCFSGYPLSTYKDQIYDYCIHLFVPEFIEVRLWAAPSCAQVS